VSVKTTGRSGAGKNRKGEGQGGNERQKSREGGCEEGGGEKNAECGEKPGSWNPGIKGGGREKEGEEKTEK
jgi:hypothetical protein